MHNACILLICTINCLNSRGSRNVLNIARDIYGVYCLAASRIWSSMEPNQNVRLAIIIPRKMISSGGCAFTDDISCTLRHLFIIIVVWYLNFEWLSLLSQYGKYVASCSWIKYISNPNWRNLGVWPWHIPWYPWVQVTNSMYNECFHLWQSILSNYRTTEYHANCVWLLLPWLQIKINN